MATFLFNEIIFGPVQSRRLGTSLGVNLLPLKSKLCNFNCIYCECGLSDDVRVEKGYIFSHERIKTELEKSFKSFQKLGKTIDTITFAGNGEPTLHPDFSKIIEDTIGLRNLWFPNTKIAVLSNATLIGKPEIHEALLKVDYNILKLDSAFEDTIRKVNCPLNNFSVKNLINNLKLYPDNLTIQTLFLKGEFNGFYIDNSSAMEVEALVSLYAELQPKLVMIYTFARETPVKNLEKIEVKRLKEIASLIENIGLPVQISA